MDKYRNTKRLGAYLIDWYIISVLTQAPIIYIASIHFDEVVSVVSLSSLPLNIAMLSLGIGILFVFLYLVILPMSKKYRGQSVGKKICQIKIVNNDGQDAKFFQLFIRSFLVIIFIEGAMYSLTTYILQMISILFSIEIPAYTTWIYTGILMLSVIIALTRKDNKMIHDFIANTKVISLKEEN